MLLLLNWNYSLTPSLLFNSLFENHKIGTDFRHSRSIFGSFIMQNPPSPEWQWIQLCLSYFTVMPDIRFLRQSWRPKQMPNRGLLVTAAP